MVNSQLKYFSKYDKIILTYTSKNWLYLAIHTMKGVTKLKDYSADKIKNIVLGGHNSSGKTSLVEAMLFKTACIDRQGKVSDGNTTSDFDPEEIKRKISISSSIIPLEYGDCKLNFLDTPGLFDFEGAFFEGLKAAESALVAVSGKSGAKVGTGKAFKSSGKQGKGCMFFVGKMEEEHADFDKVLQGLRDEFGSAVCPLVIPHGDCYVDVLSGKAYKYDKGNATEVTPDDLELVVEEAVMHISELVAETDEELMDKFFSGEAFTEDEMKNGMRKAIMQRAILPVFAGSAFTLEAIDLLLSGIAKYAPSAKDAASEKGVDAQDKEIDIPCSETDPLCAIVFKTVADPFVGKMSFFKVISGTLTTDVTPVNATTGAQDRIGKLLFIRGKKQEDVKKVATGDIGAVTKLSANTGDTLCDPSRIIKVNPAVFPRACMQMGIKPKNKGEESKIAQGLQRLIEEDPSLKFESNTETYQQLIGGLGDQHIDVVVSKLKNKFGVEVELEEPIVPYRETIRKNIKVEGKHKKQSGGHGQYGHVWIEFEPHDGEELIFEEKVFGGSVPKGFFPAVEKGLRDSIVTGPVAGYPVVGLRARLVDGSYHPVDSSEMSFKLASQAAYKSGMPQASPILLEPIGTLKVYVPDSNTGDIMGELNKRRGRVLGMNPTDDKLQLVEAEVPMAEMADFTTLLRQMTRGRGHFEFNFERYEPLPGQFTDAVVEKAAAMKKAREESK